MVVVENEKIAGETIELLEARLRRLEYFLTGDTHWTGQPTAAPKPETFDDTVARRLMRLNSSLESLGRNVPAVQDVLQLYSRFPDLFRTVPAQTIPASLTTQNLASIVLSYASTFPETSSRLTSLNDLPIPEPTLSASLIELQPRVDKLIQIQERQAKEVSDLRTRSARLLQRWYEVGLVGSGECWAEWEARLEDVDREIKREEVVCLRKANEI
ncbi:hypothetical protein V8E54_010288 [Elaphomyces granulatus]|jgi:hypothetical protein